MVQLQKPKYLSFYTKDVIICVQYAEVYRAFDV